MRFLSLYRASFYLMLTFATLTLSIDATSDNPLSMLYPLAVAVVSVLAFFTVDRNPRLGLGRNVASVLALASGTLSWAEFRYDPNLLLLAAAHWLVYLQLIKTFLPKTVEDDWFLFLLGLVQVLVGGVISQSDNVGMLLMCWALTSLWVLTLFALRRESLRMDRVPFGANDLEAADRSEPYRGLFDGAFVFSTFRVAAITLTLGGLIFLAMPRRNVSGNATSSDAVGKHLSGFENEVQLGQLGEILENDSVVMSVELMDLAGNRIVPAPDGPEQRWRGVTLDRYENGRWRRRLPHHTEINIVLPLSDEKPTVRQVIKLEPTDSQTLFGLRPVILMDSLSSDRRLAPQSSQIDGTLFRTDKRAVMVDYRVDSTNDEAMAQPGELFPRAGYLEHLVEVPEAAARAIRPIAEKIVAAIPREDLRARADAIERYFRGAGSEFRYSLSMDVGDPDLDPVADFVINRKQGHCEYFASAMTLMLRSIGIPARMVNGFKGGDYNSVAGLTTVRQKHAHSWVEVLVEPQAPADHRAFWATFDPTPADQRNESVARVGGMIGNFRQVTDLIRYIWIFYVVGFNSERQERFLYGPIKALFQEAMRGFGMIGDLIRQLLHFPNVESFFSLKGFLVSFGALLLLAGSARLVLGLFRLYRRLTWGSRADASSQTIGNQFFRRLLQLLETRGITRPGAETPREFARRAARFLAESGGGADGVADVPPLVVEAFYRLRFGNHPLSEADKEHLAARLDALEAQLRPSPA